MHKKNRARSMMILEFLTLVRTIHLKKPVVPSAQTTKKNSISQVLIIVINSNRYRIHLNLIITVIHVIDPKQKMVCGQVSYRV